MAYNEAGTWVDDSTGVELGPPQRGDDGSWYVVDTTSESPSARAIPPPAGQPGPPDPYGPGGMFYPGGTYTTADPLHPGQWYRDDPSTPGGIVRMDSQGNVVGQFANTAPLSQGGASFNIWQLDPQTGGPAIMQYPTEQGGLFGLGDVWGSLAAVGLLGAIAGSAGTLAGPVAAGTASTAATIGAGATLGSASLSVASQAAQNADLAKAGMALGLVGGAAGGVSSLASGTANLGTYAKLGGTALTAAGAATGTPGLGQAGKALGLANTAASGWPEFAGLEANAAGDTVTDIGSGTNTGGTMGTYWAPGYGDEPYYGESASGSDIPGMQTDWGTVGVDNPASGASFWDYLAAHPGLIGAGISGIGSLVGSGIQAGAAKDAASIQANAAQNANLLLAQIYGQQRADQLPYLAAGYGALGQIQGLSNFNEAPYAYQAPAPLNPASYQFQPPSGQDVLTQDPGYQFRLDQGMKALQQSAAAKGNLLSGGTLKGIDRFSQGLASQEYQNAYQRSLTQNQMNYERNIQANQQGYERGLAGNQMQYNRALTSYGTNLARLQGLSGTGQTASGILANAAGQYSSGAAGNLTSAGAATAAGRVGASNALAGGISGVGGAANNYLSYSLLSDLLNRKTT